MQIIVVVPRRAVRLNALQGNADTTGMKTSPGQSVSLESQCLVVLGCYVALEVAVKTEQADFTGWVDRISEAPGIAASDLPGIHGQLIAQGLLRFEFSGRARGLQYQVSPQGREALERGSLVAMEEAVSEVRGNAESAAQAA